MHKKILVLMVILFAAGCSQDNPLIGTWKIKPGSSSIMCKTKVFEESLATCGGLAEKVTYDIRDNEVIVHGAMGLSSVYKVIDKNTIMRPSSFGMKPKYYNRQSY